MDKETNGHLYIANDNLKRIADALETIIKMVKQDQEAVAAASCKRQASSLTRELYPAIGEYRRKT